MTIENTSDFYRRNPELVLLAGLDGQNGLDNLIGGMEARGQAQLVNSDRLPTQISGGTQAEFEAVGFVFGPVDERDPLFRSATLPEGWKREGTGHAMHSNIVDHLGRERVSVFYKAAFYDRRADMSLVTPSGYLNSFLWGGDKTALPVLDDVWLTKDVADEALVAIREGHLREAAKWDRYIEERGRTAENRAEMREFQQRDRQRADEADDLRLRIAEAAR